MASSTYYKDVEIGNLYYGPVRTNKETGSKNVYVSTKQGSSDRNDNLCFQLSKMQDSLPRAVFGVETPMAGGDEFKRGLCLSIETQELECFFKALDERNLDEVSRRSEEFFGKQLSRETIEEKYSGIYRPSPKPGELAPLVKVKIIVEDPARRTMTPTCIYEVKEVIDPCPEYPNGHIDYEPCDYASIQKGNRILAIVTTSGLWKSAAGFGMSLVATQILVWKNAAKRGMDAFDLGGYSVGTFRGQPRQKVLGGDFMKEDDFMEEDDCV